MRKCKSCGMVLATTPRCRSMASIAKMIDVLLGSNTTSVECHGISHVVKVSGTDVLVSLANAERVAAVSPRRTYARMTAWSRRGPGM